MSTVFNFFIFQTILFGITTAECPIECSQCKEIKDGPYMGRWNLTERNSTHCPTANNGNVCLYRNINNGTWMCFCDPGPFAYRESCGGADEAFCEVVDCSHELGEIYCPVTCARDPQFCEAVDCALPKAQNFCPNKCRDESTKIPIVTTTTTTTTSSPTNTTTETPTTTTATSTATIAIDETTKTATTTTTSLPTPTATCIGSSTDWACCHGQCGVGQGDCDHDSHCKGNLICGLNNCRDFNSQAASGTDCCISPDTTTTTPATTPSTSTIINTTDETTKTATTTTTSLPTPTATCIGSSTDWACCHGQCGVGQGDCDQDSHCQGNLICGLNNCRDFNSQARSASDCCISPGFSISGGPSPNEGNVFYNGAPICDDYWDNIDARVFCRMFGYQDGTATHRSTYGQVSPDFSMDNVQCNGNEISLLDCPHRTYENCGSRDGAGVICSGTTTTTPATTPLTSTTINAIGTTTTTPATTPLTSTTINAIDTTTTTPATTPTPTNSTIINTSDETTKTYTATTTAPTGCEGDNHGISCCPNYVSGDMTGGGETQISNIHTEADCQSSCKLQHPTSIGVTQHHDGRSSCWCEFGIPRLTGPSNTYKTCVFSTVSEESTAISTVNIITTTTTVPTTETPTTAATSTTTIITSLRTTTTAKFAKTTTKNTSIKPTTTTTTTTPPTINTTTTTIMTTTPTTIPTTSTATTTTTATTIITPTTPTTTISTTTTTTTTTMATTSTTNTIAITATPTITSTITTSTAITTQTTMTMTTTTTKKITATTTLKPTIAAATTNTTTTTITTTTISTTTPDTTTAPTKTTTTTATATKTTTSSTNTIINRTTKRHLYYTPLVPNQVQAGCRAGEMYNGHCYLLVSTPATWQDARLDCTNRNGRLAEIDNVGTNDFIANLAGGGDSRTWIGASDAEAEGVWKWTNGENVIFTNWESGNPDNWDGLQHCALINFHATGRWDDDTCTVMHPYVCQLSEVEKSTTARIATSTAAGVYFIAGGYGALRDISVYHPTVDNVACSISPPTLNNNWYYHTTFYHDTVHLCGGSYTESTCISYHKDTAGWKTHTLTTARKYGHSSVVQLNRIYFIGGLDSGNNNVGAESTPLPLTDTPVLTPEHNLDYKGRDPCTAKIDEDTLVVTGGYHHSSYLTTVATYNAKTRTYTQLPSLKQGRSYHGCGVLERGNTKWIIVAGGWYEGRVLQSTSTEMLQLGGSDWTRMGNLNVARMGHSMTVTQRGVMVMGGRDASWNSLSSVELLDWDSAGKTWSVVQPSINKPRFLFGGAVEIPASMFGCTV